jgi:hypothetical protein
MRLRLPTHRGFHRLTTPGVLSLIADMTNMTGNQPESFYLVCIEKPSNQDQREWDEWFSFQRKLKDDPKLTEASKALSESLWLFPAKSGVLRLSRFLEECGKLYLKPKVFFLEHPPVPCE